VIQRESQKIPGCSCKLLGENTVPAGCTQVMPGQNHKSRGKSNAQQASPQDNKRDIKMKLYMAEKSTQTDPYVDEPRVRTRLGRQPEPGPPEEQQVHDKIQKSGPFPSNLVIVSLSLLIVILAISLLNPWPTTTCIPSVTNRSNCSCQCNVTNTTNITGDNTPDENDYTLNCSNCQFMRKRQEKQISNLRNSISQCQIDMKQIKNDLSLEKTKHNQTSVMCERQVSDLEGNIGQYQIDLKQLKNKFSLEETQHNTCILKLNETKHLNQSLHTLIAQYQSNVDRFNESATKCNDQYTKLRSKYREERDSHNKELVRNNDKLTGEKLKLIKMTADYSKCLRDVETCNDKMEECELKLKENDKEFDKLKENELYIIKDCKFNLKKCKDHADLLMKDYRECMERNGSATQLDSTSSFVFILSSFFIVCFSVY
jgi:hypothetical protein